ncbi:MAG: PilZ domain-containing protein [Desulfobulbus sp.]|jgi:hypothetical protein
MHIEEHRRAPRFPDALPLEVSVVRRRDKHLLTGPFTGEILDISLHGACLLMSRQISDTLYSLHRHPDGAEPLVLRLVIDLPPELPNFVLSATPIWMGLVHQQTVPCCKLGVEFLEPSAIQEKQRLLDMLSRKQPQRLVLWQRNGSTLSRNQ